MSTNKRKLVFLLLIPVLIAFLVGYYMYNKGPVDVGGEKGIPVEAAVLYSTYINDTATGRINYTGKVLEVSGVVSGTSPKDAPGEKQVMLKTAMEGVSINCSLADSLAVLPEAGSTITIKGICVGIQGDPDLGIMGDVYLSRCVMISYK